MQIEVVLNQAEPSAGFKSARAAPPEFCAARACSLATLTRVRSLVTQVGCDLNNDNKITKVKPGSARAGIW